MGGRALERGRKVVRPRAALRGGEIGIKLFELRATGAPDQQRAGLSDGL